jgi:hypothetical protein
LYESKPQYPNANREDDFLKSLAEGGISHRVGKVRADNDSAHPGYVCRWEENGSGDLRSDPPPRQYTIAIEEASKPIVAMLLIPPRQRT